MQHHPALHRLFLIPHYLLHLNKMHLWWDYQMWFVSFLWSPKQCNTTATHSKTIRHFQSSHLYCFSAWRASPNSVRHHFAINECDSILTALGYSYCHRGGKVIYLSGNWVKEEMIRFWGRYRLLSGYSKTNLKSNISMSILWWAINNHNLALIQILIQV